MLTLIRHLQEAFPACARCTMSRSTLYPGEVTALIGENGAGKSTLVKILTGIYQPDAGEIRVDGKPVSLSDARMRAFEPASPRSTRKPCCSTNCRSPRTSFSAMRRARGFGTDRLEDDAQRGARGARRMRRRPHRRRSAAAAISASPTSIWWRSRAPCRSTPQIVIMDEPTASLSHKEIEELFELIELLKADGKAILFISHKFDEIFRIADRYTVFRDGEMVGEGLIADAEPERDRQDDGRPRGRSDLSQARGAYRRAGARPSPAYRIRPNSTTSASSCAAARSSASTAWSAPGAAR